MELGTQIFINIPSGFEVVDFTLVTGQNANIGPSYLLLGDDGKVYGMGNGSGQILSPGTSNRTTWITIKEDPGTNDVTDVVFINGKNNENGGQAAALIKANGDLYTWGQNTGSFSIGQPGAVAYPKTPLGNTEGYEYIEVGGHLAASIRPDTTICFSGHIVCGSNASLTSNPTGFQCGTPPDGCPDAAEANSVFVLTDSTVAGPYGTNGLADRIEVGDSLTTELAYTLYYTDVADSSIVVCANDFDNDGVGDLHDLDDDNDGILDTEENICAHSLEVDKSSITASSELTASPDAISTLLDDAEGNGHRFGNAQNITGKSLLEFDFGTNVLMTQVEITQHTSTSFITNHSEYVLQGWNGASWESVGDTLESNGTADASDVIGSPYGEVFKSSSSTAFSKYRVYGVSGTTSSSPFIREAHFVLGCQSYDQDGDGIDNKFDLDSDGDGCSDLAESGAGSVSDSLVSQNPSYTGSGLNGLADHLEDNDLGSAVTTYNSSYRYALANNINGCSDFDNDGKNHLAVL